MTSGPTAAVDRQPRRGDIAVALGLALGPLAAMGFGRFAYALLLPPMRADLDWSFSAAGAMNTANALGYLAGAVLAAGAARRFGSRRCYLAGLAVIVVSIATCAATDNFVVLLALRALTGVAGAFTFIVGAGMVAQVSVGSGRSRTALLLGIYVAGGGAGVVISGLTITPLLASTDAAAGWREGWLLLGGLSALALAGSIPAVRAAPEPPPIRSASDRWPARRLAVLMIGYAFFGVGYIAYMTFIVAFLVGEGASAGTVTLFWVVLGLASVAAAFGWGPLLGRLRGGRGPAVVLGVVAIGALLPLLGSSGLLVFGSAVLFGASFLTVVTAVTVLAQRSLHPRHWTPAIAALTVAFAVGQCAGPVLAGLLSDSAAGVRAGLILSVVLLTAAVVLSIAQRERTPLQDRAPTAMSGLIARDRPV